MNSSGSPLASFYDCVQLKDNKSTLNGLYMSHGCMNDNCGREIEFTTLTQSRSGALDNIVIWYTLFYFFLYFAYWIYN